MRTAVVLFNRDLRVHDHPALAEAARAAERVVGLFVLDQRILRSELAAPNRLKFLLESLADLDESLRKRGGRLVVRHGDAVGQTVRTAGQTGAAAVFASADVSAYAQARERALADARLDLRLFPGATIVPPGDVVPAGADHFRVFTPYWRRWRDEPRRPVEAALRRLALPAGISPGHLPELGDLTDAAVSPNLPRGGESAGRRRLAAWARGGLHDYAERADDLGADATSRLSPYLRFGCLSPLEVEQATAASCAYRRQLAWRDFFHQVTAARPEWAWRDYRPREMPWAKDDDEALAAWKEGRTGHPIVDAGMRQLAREGWMHNRARLITGSYLTRTLRLHWRRGAQHFWDLLVDGDIADNAGNWQWVAGTGNDTRRNRVLNPDRQAKRHDPDGAYVRRYVPECATDAYAARGPALFRA